MFFGARTPQELPYFGPLQKVPNSLLEKHLVFSRIPGADKEYVQDRIRTESATVGALLASPATHVYHLRLERHGDRRRGGARRRLPPSGP